MTTNAQRLHRTAVSLRGAGLSRLNVSLDTLDAAAYRELTGGELRSVLQGLDAARAAGFESIKINAGVLRGINDARLAELVEWSSREGFALRFLEAMPIGAAAEFNRSHFVSADAILEALSSSYHVSDLGRSAGSTARMYHLRGAGTEAEVGLIAPVTRPFCGDCRRMRLTADGRFFPCLLDSRSFELSGPLRSNAPDGELLDMLRRALQKKESKGSIQQVNMVQLGG
jgi:cyclic pyranopterin phosphate synthase